MRQRAPAAADVEDVVAGLQTERLAHPLALGLGGLRQRPRLVAVEDQRRVDVVLGVEEAQVEVLTDVVVVPDHARVDPRRRHQRQLAQQLRGLRDGRPVAQPVAHDEDLGQVPFDLEVDVALQVGLRERELVHGPAQQLPVVQEEPQRRALLGSLRGSGSCEL